MSPIINVVEKSEIERLHQWALFEELPKHLFLLSTRIWVFTEGKVHMTLAKEDGRGVRKLSEPPLAMICPHTRMASAIEGHAFDHEVDTDFIHASPTILARGHHLLRPFDVLGEQV